MNHEEYADELPLLLTGELDRSRLRELVLHLRGCQECREELVEASAAHAALTATRRTLAMPLGVTDAERPEVPAVSSDLPPLDLPRRGDRRRRAALGAVAAALVVAVGLGGSVATGHWPGGSSARSTAAERQARLVAVPAQSGAVPDPGAAGLVRMSGPTGRTDMTITTSGLPQAGTGHFYYAWLLDPATNKMLPLGVVAADSPSTFEVASDLVDRYSSIDISLQADDGDPAHSPVSVLRATYA